jgi:hypothetical protein
MNFVSQENSLSSENGTMGMSVSTLYNAEYEKDCKIKDEDKTAFDWCKEGNVEEMTKVLEKSKNGANVKDDQVCNHCGHRIDIQEGCHTSYIIIV